MTPDEIRQQISVSPLLGGTLKELSKIIQPDEKIGSGCPAEFNRDRGLLVATNKRIIFVSKLFFNVKTEEFYYNKISSIQVNSGIIYGEIIFSSQGKQIKFEKLLKGDCKKLGIFIKDQVSRLVAGKEESKETKVDHSNSLDLLERLAKLKEQGILTETEFNEKKKQILGL